MSNASYNLYANAKPIQKKAGGFDLGIDFGIGEGIKSMAGKVGGFFSSIFKRS
jgi:hypothetical protein